MIPVPVLGNGPPEVVLVTLLPTAGPAVTGVVLLLLPLSLKTGAVAVRCTRWSPRSALDTARPPMMPVGGDSDFALCDDAG